MDTCLSGFQEAPAHLGRALGMHLGVAEGVSRDPDGAAQGLAAKLEFPQLNEASGRVRKGLGGFPAHPCVIC